MLTFFAITFTLVFLSIMAGYGVVSLQARHQQRHPAHAPLRHRPRH